MTPPSAIDSTKSTGYWLLGRWLMVALSPMATLANPNPSYNTRLYFSLMPLCSSVPRMVPRMMVHVLTIVPVMMYQSFCSMYLLTSSMPNPLPMAKRISLPCSS